MRCQSSIAACSVLHQIGGVGETRQIARDNHQPSVPRTVFQRRQLHMSILSGRGCPAA